MKSAQLLDQGKQAKERWLQNPNQANGNNLNSVTGDTSRIFRNKKREHILTYLLTYSLTPWCRIF
jgi:hypothetical protein